MPFFVIPAHNHTDSSGATSFVSEAKIYLPLQPRWDPFFKLAHGILFSNSLQVLVLCMQFILLTEHVRQKHTFVTRPLMFQVGGVAI